MSSAPSSAIGSIRVRLTAWYFLVFLGSTALLAATASFRIRSSIHEKIVETVNADLVRHQQAFEARGVDGLRQLAEAPDSSLRPLYLRVVDAANVTLFEHRATPSLAFDSSSLAVGDAAAGVKRIQAQNDGSSWNFSSVPLSGKRWLQIAVSDDQTREVTGHLRSGLLAVWIAAVALGLLGGFFLTGRALRPLQRLATTARAVIDSGDLALRVPDRGTSDELDELSRLFNGVLARNQALVRGMREALDNVAHDLRTPLTRLRTGAEVALRGLANPELTREALANTVEESERVLAMLRTQMDISEAETGVMRLERSRFDFGELVRRAVELYEHVADERGVPLLTHITTGISIDADPQRIHQAIANLLDNAIKYTPTGGTVEVTVETSGDLAIAKIADTGIGIPADDLPRIWDRLYRGDQSRSERGLGLGLSFVRAIIRAHGGRVEVTSQPKAGSCFVVQLPLGR